MSNNRHVSSTRAGRPKSPGWPTEGQQLAQLSQVGSQDGPKSFQDGPRSFHVAPYSKASFGSSRDYDESRAVDVERLNSPWRRRADGNDSETYTDINQSRLSDVLSLSDRLAGRPDLISKTAAAAAEFRRLQEYEQVFRKTEKQSVIVIASSMTASILSILYIHALCVGKLLLTWSLINNRKAEKSMRVCRHKSRCSGRSL